jgi:hypothetical protein
MSPLNGAYFVMKLAKCKDGSMTDFGRMKNYANYIKEDPFRRGLHFPAAAEELGDLDNKRIWTSAAATVFFREFWRNEARRSSAATKPEEIAEARAHEDARQLDATFSRRPDTFLHDGTFHAATSPWTFLMRRSTELDGNKVVSQFLDRTSGRVDDGRLIPVHVRRMRTGRGRRRNDAAGMEETICHAGCPPTNGHFVLAAVSRASA